MMCEYWQECDKEKKELQTLREPEGIQCDMCEQFFDDWGNKTSIKETGSCCACYDEYLDAIRPDHPDDPAGRS